MRRITYSLPLLLAAVAACGDDDGGDGNTPIDAPVGIDAPDAPIGGSCGTPVTTISTYPATYEGVVLGAGNDLGVDEGACADERGYFGSSGDDHVIELTGLTAGTRYALTLTTMQDIMMYVTSDCASGEPTTGSCLLLVDETTGNESGDFIAPASGEVYLIIDTPDDVTLTTGAYTLDIAVLECTSSFDCTSAEPVCVNNACEAGGTMCTGDDANEPDDGPSAARTLAFPGAAPTVTTGAVCNVPATEADWFTFTATAAGSVRIAATWTNTAADLDFVVYDDTGAVVQRAEAVDFAQEIRAVALPAAGDYYIELYPYDPMNTAAATMYTLTLSLPECETSFQCLTGAEPVCANGECVAGPATCTGDDAADTGATSDDGPGGARPVVGAVGVPVTMNGAVCGMPSGESDWFSVTTTAHGQGIRAELGWAASGTIDLDVYIVDAQGNLVGTSFWLNPEVVTTTYLPMGTYYINVDRFDSQMAAAHAYTLTVTLTAAQTCASAASCGAEHRTQVYRGACNGTTGACEFIAAGTRANGAACDTADDCMSGDCSYIIFESDAQDSVCTATCNTTADCTAATGLGAGYTCTTGFQSNICVPQCAADLECGANLNSDALDTGLPWDFLTCTLPAGTCGP